MARDLRLRVRRSRACICASARSRAAACAGRTGRRTTAPKCSAWSRRSRSRTPSSCRSAPRAGSSRNACRRAAAATRCSRPARQAYVNFVSSLLSITDNLDGGAVIPPTGVVRRDSDDPYFVVAADKGTATFSDTANAHQPEARLLARRRLRLAAARPATTTRRWASPRAGAWEAVKRHFREMNRDIQTTPFTVVGVGDMSGDVFGNGMLLSRQTRLIAAFDHRDIFIDPDPDIGGLDGRARRMFALPRSSWQDYDKSKLSKGGVIVSRSQKSVTLAGRGGRGDRARQGDGVAGRDHEGHPQGAGRPAVVRRHRHLCQGQRRDQPGGRRPRQRRDPRHRAGGARQGDRRGRQSRRRRSAPASSSACTAAPAIPTRSTIPAASIRSDVEVNIKIALASAMRKGSLTRPARNKLLAEMTDEVGALVLSNNYQQTLALSLARKRGLADLPHQARFMTALEARGLLDRAVETLPVAAGAGRARSARRAADPGRARRAAGLCQDRAVHPTSSPAACPTNRISSAT